MQSRVLILSGVLTLLVLFGAAGAATAVEYHIGGGSGEHSYATLEDFRKALNGVPPDIYLADGDVISLYKDDSTLTDYIEFPDQVKITFRSVGGMYTVRGQDYPEADAYVFSTTGVEPKIYVENIRFTGNSGLSPSAVTIRSLGPESGTLNISNSVFEDNHSLNSGGVTIFGAVDATITNTVFQNNTGYIAGAIYANNDAAEGDLNLTIRVDSSGPSVVTWKKNASVGYDEHGEPISDTNSIKMVLGEGNDMSLTMDVAKDKILDIRDPLYATMYSDTNLNITKTGEGVWKQDGYNFFYPALLGVDPDTGDPIWATNTSVNFTVKEGVFHARENLTWYAPYGSIRIEDGATFRPTITTGTLESKPEDETEFEAERSYFFVDRFIAEDGAKLEVSKISTLPRRVYSHEDDEEWGDGYIWYPIISAAEYIDIGDTMKIDNRLLKVELRHSQDDPNVAGLYITRIEDISSLGQGIGAGIDQIRRNDDISDAIRDLIDAIYWRGGVTQSDKAFLQTLNGSIVMNSQLAMRNNYAALLRKIAQRVTGIQKEELEVAASDAGQCLGENEPLINYGQLWAYIDQNWTRQQDVGGIAGYNYSNYGVGIGYDRHIEELILGGLLRYDDGDMKLRSNTGARTDVQTFLASAYASWASEGLYVSGGATFGYGWNKSTSSYAIPGHYVTARTGHYVSTMYGLNTEAGYMMNMGDDEYPFRVTPYAGLAFARMNREATTETGAGELDRNFRRASWNMWDLSLGARFALPLDYGKTKIIPSLDVAFVRNMGDASDFSNGNVQLVNDPSNVWGVQTLGPNRSALRLSANIDARITDNLNVGFSYDFEWRKRSFSNQLGFNMTWGF